MALGTAALIGSALGGLGGALANKKEGGKGWIVLYHAEEKNNPFKLIKRDPIYGRALGFGGAEELAWSADGKTLFFTLREAGRIEPLSTNLDIFSVPADGSAKPVNLTDANDATDTMPVVSPDGKWLAYAAMKRPGYEADRLVLMLRNIATSETRALTEGWDRSIGSIAWEAHGKGLLVTANDVLDNPVFRVDAASGKVTRLTEKGHAGSVVPLPQGGFVLLQVDVADVPGRPEHSAQQHGQGYAAINREPLQSVLHVHRQHGSDAPSW